MGQKVHPKGLRIGTLYNWNSRWFFSNKKAFRESLIADLKLRKALMDKFRYASVTQIDIERAINKVNLIIYSVKPGMIIGRGGKGLEEVRKFVEMYIDLHAKGKEVKFEPKIEPVKKPYLNAYYVAQNIAEKLVRNFPHRGVVHNAIDRATEAGAKGIKIQLGGRIGGAEISRREKYPSSANVPTSTIRADIDYAKYPALTKSGYIGVKVWIYK